VTLHVERSSISKSVAARLDIFAGMLLRWNAAINLIAGADARVLRSRHIDDCLQLAQLMAPTLARAIDLGSGAGFPGVVLAIATDVPFDLIESDHRKAAFLREAGRATGAPVTVHAKRIEDADLPPAELVTARALARLPRLLDLAAPKLAPGGVCLFMKGADAEAELTDAARRWHMRIDHLHSRTDASAKILRISEIARVARV